MQYQTLFDFENALAEFTGAPYAVVTDCCTHALELCLIYDRIKACSFTPYTYLSVPMLMTKLKIDFSYLEESTQTWIGEYQLMGTRIWDSARLLKQDMYRPGQRQCLSFGNTKPLQLGRAGAILLDDPEAYRVLSMLRSDGRDLRIHPWISQREFLFGFHYCPTLEICKQGLDLLSTVDQEPKFVRYNDCRQVKINQHVF